MLFISWIHWLPSYVRTEIKKKLGINVDEYGKKIEEDNDENIVKSITADPNEFILNKNQDQNQKPKLSKKEYTPINSYKPSGNLIYDDAVLNKIEGRLFK
jgi:hypothetical protein